MSVSVLTLTDVGLLPYALFSASMHGWTLPDLYCRLPEAVACVAFRPHCVLWYVWQALASNWQVDPTWQIAFAYAVQKSLTDAYGSDELELEQAKTSAPKAPAATPMTS
jgi:hypothetical protein